MEMSSGWIAAIIHPVLKLPVASIWMMHPVYHGLTLIVGPSFKFILFDLIPDDPYLLIAVQYAKEFGLMPVK